MTDLLPRCGDEMSLTADELTYLLEHEDQAEHATIDRLTCPLEADHKGNHCDLAQTLDGQEFWLLWGRDGKNLPFKFKTGMRFMPFPACPAVDPADEEDACLLFDGHFGAHSFEMEPAAAPVPSRRFRQRIAADLRSAMTPEQLHPVLTVEGLLKEPADAPALPLFTAHEAMAVGMLLMKLASDDWIVEDSVVELLGRLEERLEQAGIDGEALLAAVL